MSTFRKLFQLKKLQHELNFNNLNVDSFNEKANLNLSKLSIARFNDEERTGVIDMCTKYADIFYNLMKILFMLKHIHMYPRIHNGET